MSLRIQTLLFNHWHLLFMNIFEKIAAKVIVFLTSFTFGLFF